MAIRIGLIIRAAYLLSDPSLEPWWSRLVGVINDVYPINVSKIFSRKDAKKRRKAAKNSLKYSLRAFASFLAPLRETGFYFLPAAEA